MKAILLATLLVSSNAVAADVTCESLENAAEETCREAICGDVEAEGLECIEDGDFRVALVECRYEEFLALLENHNQTNPAQKLTCED